MSDFKNNVEDNIMIIYFPSELDSDLSARFKERMNAWLLSPVDCYVIDFAETRIFKKNFYQIFLQFKAAAKGTNKLIYSINMDPQILKQIKEDGMDLSFSPTSSLDDVKIKINQNQKETKKIDLDFISPFLKGAVKAFEVQCNTPVKCLSPYLKDKEIENISIVGVLTLISDKLQGSVVLSFPEKVFLKVYENMFGEPQASITKDSEDAASELLNIIYGAAKVELNQKGYNFPKALPKVLTGEQLKLNNNKQATIVVIPFETAAGLFYLEIESKKI